MVRMFNAVGDRLLRAVPPKAEAKAYNCWYPNQVEICCYYPEMTVPRTYCWGR
ncbi:hypothetical protein ABT297_29135 [Dactylosporangium sp. NPDC000555]|uniref:hypothetical protein n=1 Tax=Dactylosporangium sp. NPDC000555 TaxID=3154260 RepID=UPI003331E134